MICKLLKHSQNIQCAASCENSLGAMIGHGSTERAADGVNYCVCRFSQMICTNVKVRGDCWCLVYRVWASAQWGSEGVTTDHGIANELMACMHYRS